MPDNSEGFSYKKLIKLLGMTTSQNDAEALSFMRAANAEIDKLGKTWHEFIMSKVTVVADPFDKVPDPAKAAPDPDPGRNPPRWQQTAAAPQRPAPPPPPRPTRPAPRPAPAPDYSYMGAQSYMGQTQPRPRAQPDPFQQTSGRPATAKQPTRVSNRFAGLCVKCKERVAPGDGEAFLDGKLSNGKDRWSVEHTPGTCPQKAKPAPIKGTIADLDDMISF